MISEMHELLRQTARRLHSRRLWSSLAVCWLCWALVVFVIARSAAELEWHWPTVWALLAFATVLTAAVCWVYARRITNDLHGVAQRIEAAHPELGAGLLAALELATSDRSNRLGYLQSTVIQSAVEHGKQHNWAGITSVGTLRLAQLAQWTALAALLAAAALLFDRAGVRASNQVSTSMPGNQSLGNFDVEVTPGDTEVERGTTLVVIAKFNSELPPDASLVVREIPPTGSSNAPASSEAASAPEVQEHMSEMTRSLDDPQFVGRVPSVDNDFDYAVAFAGGRTADYHVSVFEYPELVRADAQLKFPEYMHAEPKIIEDVRRVTAVEGTQLKLTCQLNKDVAKARLVDADGEELALSRENGATPKYQVAITLRNSQRYKLYLTDDRGRTNKLPPEFVVNVTRNQPPTIKLTSPGKDVEVSPLEELTVAAEISDDIGIVSAGISYSLGTGDPIEVSLVDQSETKSATLKQTDVTHLIDFEALGSEPDQLGSYYVWAEDMGPDGQPRRTMSDMFFAEVRPFEAIFRQGEQPPGGQAGAAGAGQQQSEELLQLQKQIVTATWSLIRREAHSQPSDAFASDLQTIHDAQQQALTRAREMREQLEDQQALSYLDDAEAHMTAATDEMNNAFIGHVAEPLHAALAAEQAAYQDLLKLRAREFEVVRSNAAGGGQPSGAGSASRRQLQQLELSNDQNRYETQTSAQAQQQNSQQLDESRQILDRLRELARRQDDLNERVRELQSQLALAQNEQDRQEIERQLKRLREQQREILRDAEALQNDMQNSQNANSLAQAEQQLSQTRGRVQEAAEALDQGELSEALNAGARAENELSQLRDEFRQRTADRFTEEMQELRQAARNLDERQQQLSEQLDQLGENRRSLRDSGAREELAAGMEEQQRELGSTLERMRQTVAEAEEPEPLLARELYDTTQEVEQQQTEQALDVARQLADAGALREAREGMQVADQGIRRLREGVEQAAESVLGDEAEALRRANEQLQNLGEQINREIQQGLQRAPNDAGESSTESNPDSGRRPGPGTQAQQEEQQRGQGGSSPAEPGDSPGTSPGQAGQQETAGEGQSGGGPNRSDNPTTGQVAGEQSSDGQVAGNAGGANRSGGRGNPQGRGGGAILNLEDFARDAETRGPITGESFRQWSEGMRDIEDMLDDAELSAAVARIRDRVEQARVDYTRHSKIPDWTKLRDLVADPIAELSSQIEQEIRRHESPDSLATVDRDSAPAEYAEQVRNYYERLGSGQ